MNPELQPEANLKALEQEVSLTKEEITKFQNLSPEEQEKQKQGRLAKLLELQNKLEQAVADGAKAGNFEEARRLKEQIEKEIADLEQVIDSELSIESLKLQYQFFLEDVLGKSKRGFVPTLVKPEDLDYVTLKNDMNIAKFGEYTLNPDTQNLDFENIPKSKIFIANIPDTFVGKPLFEVFKYLIDTYSNTHYIPGIEYWKWLKENPTKTPVVLRNTDLVFCFPGSLVRYLSGSWYVPCADWYELSWSRDTLCLDNAWSPNDRVALIEK